MSDPIETQSANVLPSRRGNTFPLTVDSTARSYDLAPLLADQSPFSNGGKRTVFIRMSPVGADVWFHTRSDSGAADLDDTAKVSAGGTLTPNNAYGRRMPDGCMFDLHFEMPRDRYLVIKCASGSSGTLTLDPSSNEAGPA